MNKTHKNAIVEIIRTGHWFTDSVSQELKEFDIYEPQFNVLRILQGAKTPLSVSTILERMIQRSSNITRIVDKLEAKGLVKRTLSTVDRRKMDIEITNEGSKLLKKLNKKVDAIHKPLIQNISEEEAQTLYNLIKKLKGNQ